MVKIAGKEYTDEQLAKLIEDKAAAEALVKEQGKKLKSVDDQSEKLKEFDKLKKDNETQAATILQNTLNNRLSMISKWFNSKDDSKDLANDIAQMSDNAFDLFKEGKTDDMFKSKAEIDAEQTNLDAQKTEFETNKEKIITDAIKKAKGKETNTSVIPPTEVTSEASAEDISDRDILFPPTKDIKEMFNLEDNSMYDIKSSQEETAQRYLKTAYKQDRQ